MEVAWRSATIKDLDFLYTLHRASMRDVVLETWGEWDDAWQAARFRNRFVASEMFVVTADGVDAGMVQVQRRSEEIFLAMIEILPAMQRKGIGSTIIRRLQAEASERGVPVVLQVLKSNREARRLYERLGFVITGEKEHHVLFLWEAK